MMRRLPALLVLLLPLGAAAQSNFGFQYSPRLAPVLAAGDTLRHAWVGGLNSPQYSNIDLNGDGQQDMFVFDRIGARVLTFLNVANPGGGRRWQYAPDYESVFPAGMYSWALLRDYDCDGRPDLWTLINGTDVAVFRNVAGANGRATFQQVTLGVQFNQANGQPYGATRVLVNPYDIPAIQDVNGDGKPDMLIPENQGSGLQLLLNNSASCGGLTYNYLLQPWAGLNWCGTSGLSYAANNASCRPNAVNHGGGGGMLLQDFDNDGDLDLLIGRDAYPEMAAIRNTGSNASPATTTSSILATIPNGVGTVYMPNYPVPYAVDATLDGKPDLVVASGLVENGLDYTSMRHNGLWFENTGTAAAPVYQRRTGSFLQDEMIDVSEGAATAFADLDGDGKVDMLVSNFSDQMGQQPYGSADYRATIAYYRNVGTASSPAFSLVTNDYLGLSSRNFREIRPMLTDITGDGAVDLVFDAYYIGSNNIFYFQNNAAAGRAVAFDASQLSSINNVGNRRGDTPCFTDVDGDGALDLLIGSYDAASGPLSYYHRDPAQPLNSGFTLVTRNFGGLRTTSNTMPMLLAPAVADVDGDGTPDLLTIDHTGVVHMYANYRAQGAIFLDRTDLFRNALTGQYEPLRLSLQGANEKVRNHITLKDLNADGAPELVLGTEAGGLLLYTTRNRVTSTRTQAAEALPLQVYPNPAERQVTVETTTATRVVLRDLLGRVVLQAAAAQRHQLNVQSLPAGVYLLEATDATGRRGVQRLTVK